jgi:hypothetical protein
VKFVLNWLPMLKFGLEGSTINTGVFWGWCPAVKMYSTFKILSSILPVRTTRLGAAGMTLSTCVLNGSQWLTFCVGIITRLEWVRLSLAHRSAMI